MSAFTTICDLHLLTVVGGVSASQQPPDLSKQPLDKVVFHGDGMASRTTPGGGCHIFSTDQLKIPERMGLRGNALGAVGGSVGARLGRSTDLLNRP